MQRMQKKMVTVLWWAVPIFWLLYMYPGRMNADVQQHLYEAMQNEVTDYRSWAWTYAMRACLMLTGNVTMLLLATYAAYWWAMQRLCSTMVYGWILYLLLGLPWSPAGWQGLNAGPDLLFAASLLMSIFYIRIGSHPGWWLVMMALLRYNAWPIVVIVGIILVTRDWRGIWRMPSLAYAVLCLALPILKPSSVIPMHVEREFMMIDMWRMKRDCQMTTMTEVRKEIGNRGIDTYLWGVPNMRSIPPTEVTPPDAVYKDYINTIKERPFYYAWSKLVSFGHLLMQPDKVWIDPPCNWRLNVKPFEGLTTPFMRPLERSIGWNENRPWWINIPWNPLWIFVMALVTLTGVSRFMALWRGDVLAMILVVGYAFTFGVGCPLYWFKYLFPCTLASLLLLWREMPFFYHRMKGKIK